MKSHRLTRRQFFKLSLFSAGALALPAISLASVVAAPSKEAQAAAEQPHKLAVPQPDFTPIATATAFGTPTDISMGWDGTVWSIDTSGAPHLYDPTRDTWLPHGDGIDAAAFHNDVFYFFRGDQVLQINNGVAITTSIASTFPNAPDSFKLRVTGAASVSGKLVLFNGGRYAPADGSAPAKKLTDLPNWPATPTWRDGVVTGVYSDGGAVTLLNGADNVIYIDLLSGPVFGGSGKIADLHQWGKTLPADWLTAGFDAGFQYAVNGQPFDAIFKGTAVAQFDANASVAAKPAYLPVAYPEWPETWHPRLQHAPSGRMANLWVATVAGRIVRHDGEAWQTMPGAGVSAAVGQDGTVMVASQGGLFRWNGSGYDGVGNAGPLAQVSLGDAGHVWVRNAANQVLRFDATTGFTAVNLGAGVPNPTHMAANADGTLWHAAAGNPNAFRLISESNNPSSPIQLKGGGIVTSVNKVASTGYGAAHVLATHQDGSTQAYRYDSPYVFKTSQSYSIMSSQFEHGLGCLFFLDAINGFVSGQPFQAVVVALDAHTGREVSRSAPNAPNAAPYRSITFDPIHDLIYVTVASGTSNDQATPGQVLALDARDLTKVRWQFTTPTGIDAAPALNGTQLCFSDRTNRVYLFDTRDALQNSAAPQPKWTWQVPTQGAGPKSDTHVAATPVLANGNVYLAAWDIGTIAPGGNEFGSALYFAQCNAANGSDGIADYVGFVGSAGGYTNPNLLPPALGRMSLSDGSTPQAIYLNGILAIHGVNIDAVAQGKPASPIAFNLPDAKSQIGTGIVFDDGTRIDGSAGAAPDPVKARVWFGDTNGNLWSLHPASTGLTPKDNTPLQVKKAGVVTTPVLYKDPQGGLTVLFGLNQDLVQSPPSLYGFDPDNGNIAGVSTGVTLPFTLSKTVTNGMIYVGGLEENISTNSVPQVFGIRVDELPQALRDFIIESQQMQDPDQNAQGGSSDPSNPIPPSVARYQTHLTIVDEQRVPQAHEAVKIWCDTPNTKIVVGGVSYTAGPDDGQYALVKTGTDGSLVITMDASDYFAPTLRVWAAFMDPFERIVVNADAEFHQRVMTAHSNAGDDDPSKVNLVTAKNYRGASLFTDAEKNQSPSMPQNVANAIQTADKGLGINSGNGNSKLMYRKLMQLMGVKHKNQRIQVKWVESTSTEPYLAYADLAGATHFPTNIPSSRPATIVQPIGLRYARPSSDATQPPAFTPMSHADARQAIDALQGEPWQPGDPHGSAAPFAMPARAFNIFQDFWNWLKGLFDKIVACVLSIAEDILAGIQYFVGEVLKVFKAIIKVLEDVFPFLGSFFKMLEKAIDDVLEAMSILFNFGEIIKTHRWLRDQINALLGQAEQAITNNVKPAVDSFFQSGESAVKNAFDALIKKIEPNKQGNNLKGAGSTPHTAFSAGQGAYGQGGTSHAVQCSYGLQKLKQNAQAGTEKAGVAFGVNLADDDPIVNLWTTFTNQISNDPALNSAISGLSSSASNLFSAPSAGEFFRALLVTLLELIETLVEGALVVANAFVDLLLNAIGDIISTTQSFLNTPIEIPFISWLYQTVFGEPLTFLNALCLVAAIPITVLYRVIEGRYPSQDFPTGALSVAVSPVVTKLLGAFSGMLAFAAGIINAFNDVLGEASNAFLSKLSAVLSLAGTAITIPLAGNDAPSFEDWVAWGGEWAASALGIFGAIEWTGTLAELWEYSAPGLTTAIGLFQIILFSVAFANDAQFDPNTDLGFASSLLSAFPGVVNPLKLAGEIGAIFVAGIDFWGGIAVCVIDMVVAFAGLGSTPPNPQIKPRLYLPWVPIGAEMP